MQKCKRHREAARIIGAWETYSINIYNCHHPCHHHHHHSESVFPPCFSSGVQVNVEYSKCRVLLFTASLLMFHGRVRVSELASRVKELHKYIADRCTEKNNDFFFSLKCECLVILKVKHIPRVKNNYSTFQLCK